MTLKTTSILTLLSAMMLKIFKPFCKNFAAAEIIAPPLPPRDSAMPRTICPALLRTCTGRLCLHYQRPAGIADTEAIALGDQGYRLILLDDIGAHNISLHSASPCRAW